MFPESRSISIPSLFKRWVFFFRTETRWFERATVHVEGKLFPRGLFHLRKAILFAMHSYDRVMNQKSRELFNQMHGVVEILSLIIGN